MADFFKPNIDTKGRVMRLAWGILCVGGGIAVGMKSGWLPGGVIIAAGVFSLFESLRGWCILRACGIKTKL